MNKFILKTAKDKIDFKVWSATDICQKWWAYMKPLMETNPDDSPVSRNLKEVFYLE
ncbi:L-rhamnose mutarotase [Paenibacillus sp. F4]|uniref:L-rhamnose mutarotase n=1 Tax=unclassified Paenibacillus TaxID=185978 RepID=UPI0035B52342